MLLTDVGITGDGRAVDLTSTKAAQWAAESVPEPFTTTKNLASRPVVAALAHGDTAKRQTCRLGYMAKCCAEPSPVHAGHTCLVLLVPWGWFLHYLQLPVGTGAPASADSLWHGNFCVVADQKHCA